MVRCFVVLYQIPTGSLGRDTRTGWFLQLLCVLFQEIFWIERQLFCSLILGNKIHGI